MLRSVRSSLVVVAAVSCVANALLAQRPAPPDPGARVRVFGVPGTAAPRKAAGFLVARTRDSLIVMRDSAAALVVYSTEQILQLQASVGKKSAVGQGMLIGFGVGVVAGIVSAARPNGDPECTEVCETIDAFFDPYEIVALGVLGLAGGAIAGAFVRVEKWTTVPIRTDARLKAGVLHGRPGVFLNARF